MSSNAGRIIVSGRIVLLIFLECRIDSTIVPIGAEVGVAVGNVVGDVVGNTVGDAVGNAVGDAVVTLDVLVSSFNSLISAPSFEAVVVFGGGVP